MEALTALKRNYGTVLSSYGRYGVNGCSARPMLRVILHGFWMNITKNKLTNKLLGTTFTALLLASCGARDSGGGAGDGSPVQDLLSAVNTDGTAVSCDLPDMRRWVEANMHDYYLFYDQVPAVDLNGYTDLSTLINDLRVSPNDKFSYISDAATSTAQFEQGEIFGFGQQIVVTSDNRVRFTQIHAGSPFALAEVERGDYLLTINGSSPFAASDQEKQDFFGVSNQPATLTFTVEDELAQVRTLTLTSKEFNVATVLASSIINQGSQRIGYLAFDSFLETSRTELDTVFNNYQTQNINELILDLRYNRGGRIDVARELASKIVGASAADSVFTTLALNDKYSQNNESINFSNEPNALGLSRLVVLTTDKSCSASELIINGLRPFMEVVVIGGTTCGKPYGTLARESCGKAMNALQFELVNADSVGGYYNGINADCAATDDLEHALGDSQESMLSSGVNYLTAGNCPTPRNKPEAPHSWPIPLPAYNLLLVTGPVK